MLALDHIVFAGSDAAKASAHYGERLSIKAIRGGEHEQWGTYNFLAYFSNNCYIEWLGIDNAEIARQSSNPLIQHLVYINENNMQGPYQLALRTTQMDDYIAHFQQNNIPFQGPFPGERKTTAGKTLKWRMLFPEYDYKNEMLPFLIEWDNLSGEPSTTSLANPQAITDVDFGGVDKKRFTEIYQLKPKRLFKNKYPLQNAKISFVEDKLLDFTLI
ncbi:VOC family protein [Oceanobacillus halotolerans]|uniref:VOC family protein n=1 Tax=Oceanobacillus halotolerans TaxID=2663380 RepID=UPI0013DC9051|nr:VOC family protein [Oceanobacillus halotolerans]